TATTWASATSSASSAASPTTHAPRRRRTSGRTTRRRIPNGRTENGRSGHDLVAGILAAALARPRAEPAGSSLTGTNRWNRSRYRERRFHRRASGSGRIRAIGVSNYFTEQMEAFRQVAPIHTAQPPYNLFEREAEEDVLRAARARAVRQE